jgi:peptidoglycan glycosyltransferase
LCLVSAPSYDPLNVPADIETNDRYEGAYLNRFLSSTFTPGSVFKTVTLAAAIEQFPDLFDRTWSCPGSVQIGDDTVICSGVHGEQTTEQAFANSCNVAFAQIGEELGGSVLKTYAEKAGLTASYSVDGLPTAKGTFDLDGVSAGDLGWASVGQYHDLVNPCSLMVYMGAIAGGGRAAVPRLIGRTVDSLGLYNPIRFTQKTGTLIKASTAERLAELMANNVTETYGTSRFPNMDLCAKSGTAEVGADRQPHAWFAGFLRNEDAPYAFVVLVENGGGGSSVAGTVAGKVLDVIVNGY